MREYLSTIIAALAFATVLQGQDLLKEALESFPPETTRVEYSNAAKLRALPNYPSLRQRYLGTRLQALEKSLSELGVRESDVSEFLLGWQAGKAEMELYGIAAGRFDSKAIRSSAEARGLKPTPLDGRQTYCLQAGLAGTCVLLLEDSRGLFGSLVRLNTMIGAQGGQATSLAGSDRFSKLASEASKTRAPIWGVAVGPAISDWFKSWMPSRPNLELDWSRLFGGVEALTYDVQAANKVGLNVRLDCATQEAAANLRRMLEGVKLLQQLAWQNQNPNRSNPFETLDLKLEDRRVDLSLVTAYDALTAAGATP